MPKAMDTIFIIQLYPLCIHHAQIADNYDYHDAYMYMHYRNPEPNLRPDICETVVALQQPDFHILKWTQDDLATCNSEKAKVIGSPLEEGYCLYQDLQRTYFVDVSVPNKNLSNMVGSNKQAEN